MKVGKQIFFTGERIFRGTLVAFSADTLGSHYVGGFVEGVGTSLRKCRSCWCIGADVYLKVFFVIAIILIITLNC